MIRYDGIPLTSVSASIGILDIQEKAPSIQTVTASRTKADGLRRLYKKKTVRVISIEFDIFEQDQALRREIFNDVLLWADGKEGKWLAIEHSGNRHIVATCTKYPDYSAKDECQPLKMEFTSYNPYWIDDQPTTLSFSTSANAKYTGSMIVGGSAKSCPLALVITNAGTVAMNSATITAGDASISLTGLSLAVGAKLEVGYDDEGLMYMRVGTTSVLSKRTDASSDDLMLVQRASNTVTVLTSTKANVSLIARGYSL
ncbi:MAG: hypothetical protein RR301_11650 [Clostridia bacterium]